MITIKDISVSGLQDFIRSSDYKTMNDIPITRHRGLSHINNPSAAPDDRILFLAYDNDKFAGYLGAMPDEMKSDHRSIKVAWLSCMWVDRSQRGKGIAPMLLTHAYKTWNGNLLITNFIPIAKRAYDKTGLFTELISLPGIRGYLRFNLEGILIAKKSSLAKIRILLRVTDWCLNAMNEIRLLRWHAMKLIRNIEFEYVNDVDDETLNLIKEDVNHYLFPKNRQKLQWFIRNPWILNVPFKDLNGRRYVFSSGIPYFNQHFIKIYDESHKLIAFVVLTYREANLKTPFIFCSNDNAKSVKRLIYAHALKAGIRTITTYNPVIYNAILSSPNPFIFTRKMNYKFLIGKKLKDNLGNVSGFVMQEGDGDAAFV